jgi:hypothetical protein
MKHILFAVFFSLNGCLLMAQFGPAVFIDSSDIQRVHGIKAADFNNDGQTDLLTANIYAPDIMQLYTRTGETQFSYQVIPEASLAATIFSFDIGDIDNDGWIDFVSPGADQYLTWFENNNGSFTPHLIDSNTAPAEKIMLSDLNNDGKLDIVSIQQFRIVTYLALTSGTFDTAHVLLPVEQIDDFDIADYDGNGTPDIAAANSGFKILLNDGSGNFTFQYQQIGDMVTGLQSGDLDGDDDTDLAVFFPFSDELLFYENDGDGNFQLNDTILMNQLSYELSKMADLDCDADQDLLIAYAQGPTSWLENDGTGHFTTHSIHTETGNLFLVNSVADMNADGALDVIWGSRQLAMHFNECEAADIAEAGMEELIVYPNPSNDDFTIGNPGNVPLQICVSDISGRIVFSRLLEANNTVSINVPGIGMYVLQAVASDGQTRITRKLLRSQF